jgi:hypothetical protein
MLNDGLQRRWYDKRVRAIATLPSAVQSAEREALKQRARRRFSPFGRAFSKRWSRRHPGRGTLGRPWVTNSQVDTLGLHELAAGCVLLASMGVWAFLGVIPLNAHLVSLVGGTIGGILGGLSCESRELWLILVGHLAGAGIGAAGLVGMTRLARKL